MSTTITNEYKAVKGGLFLVSRDGHILRKNQQGGYDEASKSKIESSRSNNSYTIVTIGRNNKQKQYYTHRLIAQAFVEKPDDKDQVIFIDGDSTNVCADNLMWGDINDRIIHSFKLGKVKTLENTDTFCPNCSNPMLSGLVCSDCRHQQRLLKKRLIRQQEQRDEYRIPFKNIEMYKEKHQEIIRRRFRGETMQEVGDYLGVTRQSISLVNKQISSGNPLAYVVDTRKPQRKEL